MKIVFMGTPDFAVSILDAVAKAGHEIVLICTQPDKPRGRSGKLAPSDVKVWALEHEIEVFQPKKIREPESIEFLSKYEADVFLVAAFGQILPKAILDMPRLGCVNVHASLLPKYRGAAPIQWAVINGEKVAGVTTMMMGEGLDNGDMLLKAEIELDKEETGGSLFDRLAILGGELAVTTLEKLNAGEITPIPQNEAEATHVGMIKKEMGSIDFSRSAIELERLMRGLDPWPSAYTLLDGKNLKLFRADIVEKSGKPGEILDVNKDGFTVASGKDALFIKELQIEGKKRMKAGDFLRGYSLSVGTILG